MHLWASDLLPTSFEEFEGMYAWKVWTFLQKLGSNF